ncbi:MAG: sigma-70 family RNA polymerase sigma factor [Phycisphaerae bacterium]|nr:sigma-70 family RNA polymerase sigma factor [Phycisphaerae bacterium]
MGQMDRALFEVLVEEQQKPLRAFVLACTRDPAAAEDIVQDAFLTACQHLDDFDHTRPFAWWIRGIARNKVLAYFRAADAAGRHVRILPREAIDAIGDQFGRLLPGRGDTLADTLAVLRECLTTLPTADQEIVQRHYRDGQTCRTIADHVGQTTEAIKKRLQRARSQLHGCILAKLERGAADFSPRGHMEQAHG